jgi:hypothetical protein
MRRNALDGFLNYLPAPTPWHGNQERQKLFSEPDKGLIKAEFGYMFYYRTWSPYCLQKPINICKVTD